MPSSLEDKWKSLSDLIRDLIRDISRVKTVNINKVDIKKRAKESVIFYFRNIESEFRQLQIDCDRLDSAMQRLLDLANGNNRKQYYLETLREIDKEINKIELEMAKRLGQQSQHNEKVDQSDLEKKIISTLEKLLPSTANCYKQMLLDLSDRQRISLQGTASELREVLRNVLDYLAPDDVVMKAPDFRPEPDMKKPTMKQKVHFILKSRGKSKNSMKAPEDATSIIEESRPSLFRSTYERASVSTHLPTTRDEVFQLKLYVDSVLCELLVIR